MKITTILNKRYPLKGFVYQKSQLTGKYRNEIEIQVVARKGSKAICSKCGKAFAGYDKLPSRRFELIPILGLRTFFVYARRRVNCKTCLITGERVPWANGKSPLTKMYAEHLASLPKKKSQ